MVHLTLQKMVLTHPLFDSLPNRSLKAIFGIILRLPNFIDHDLHIDSGASISATNALNSLDNVKFIQLYPAARGIANMRCHLFLSDSILYLFYADQLTSHVSKINSLLYYHECFRFGSTLMLFIVVYNDWIHALRQNWKPEIADSIITFLNFFQAQGKQICHMVTDKDDSFNSEKFKNSWNQIATFSSICTFP